MQNINHMDYAFLLVDDHDLTINLLTSILVRNGYKNIREAKNGTNALKIIEKNKIDFAIIDWYMPVMNGIELVTKIRNDPKNHTISVLMVTGEMSQDKIIYALEEGIDGYEQKPFNENRIMSAIKAIFKNRLKPEEMHYEIQKLSHLKLFGKHTRAIDYAEQLLKKKRHPSVLTILIECHYNQKNFDKAKLYINELLELKNDSKALNYLGKICIKEDNFEEALQYLKQSCVRNPLNRQRRIELGSVYAKLGLVDETTEIFDEIKQSKPSDLELVEMGKVYLAAGKIKEAGAFLRQTLDPLPESVMTYNKFAIELRKIGEYGEAIRQYQRCLKIAPQHHAILYNLGRIYFEIGRYAEASVALEESIKSRATPNAQNLLDYIEDQNKNLLYSPR